MLDVSSHRASTRSQKMLIRRSRVINADMDDMHHHFEYQ